MNGLLSPALPPYGDTAPPPAIQRPALPGGSDIGANKIKARQVAEDFESFFLTQMLELMDPQLSKQDNDMFSGGFGEEMFKPIKNEHMAKAITESGGIGLADMIYSELIKQQETNQ